MYGLSCPFFSIGNYLLKWTTRFNIIKVPLNDLTLTLNAKETMSFCYAFTTKALNRF